MPSDTAVTDFVQAVALLVRRVRAEGADDGLSWSQAIALKHLATDGPATIADLARAEGVKPQSMGTTIAALEEMGLVERKPHPTDRRQMNVALTAKGIAERKRSGDLKRAWLMQAIARLDEDEQGSLFKAGEIIKRLAES